MKKYKSSLVVWDCHDNPVIETFYSDSLDEIQDLMVNWMDRGGYKEAKIHLYENVDGEWNTIRQGDLHREVSLPEFALLFCSPHEPDDVRAFMQGTVLHIPSGRIVRFLLNGKEYIGNDVIHTEVILNKDEDGSFSFALLKLTEDDTQLLNDGKIEELKEKLTAEFFTPFIKWFKKYNRYRQKNNRDGK